MTRVMGGLAWIAAAALLTVPIGCLREVGEEDDDVSVLVESPAPDPEPDPAPDPNPAPPPPSTQPTVDPFGIRKIYPTKAGGDRKSTRLNSSH